ncbi:MAG: hypothetical protein KA314_20095 [Chloroflexi bacterium]|nr:hypothetical protein [Chloroflexota bacterium]MBP8058139.1 hypothetical protein [Chloroflexota bacterium]
MLRRLRFILLLSLVTPVLLGVGPWQEAEGGFQWQWWYWLCLIGVAVFGLLLFLASVASRTTPSTEKQPELFKSTLSTSAAPPPPPVRVETKPAPRPTVVPKPILTPTPQPVPAAPPTPTATPVSFAPPVKVTPAPVTPDAFSDKLEGVGPKIQEILYAAEIKTFTQLAATDVSRLKQILAGAGERYRLADPESWPEQARLAAAGDWAALQTLQTNLKGGRTADSH